MNSITVLYAAVAVPFYFGSFVLVLRCNNSACCAPIVMPSQASLMYPTISSIASELLDDILSDALAFARDDWYKHIVARRDFCLVCREWKDLIYNCGTQWTQLNIHPYTDPEFIRFCLRRSKAAPLSISIELVTFGAVQYRPTRPGGRPTKELTTEQFCLTILPILSQSSSRIRDLDVLCETAWASQELITSVMQFNSPCLRNVAFNLSRPEGYPRRPFNVFVGSPRLHSLSLHAILPAWAPDVGLYHDLSTLKLEYPWRTGRMSWYEVAQILELTPRLSTMHFVYVDCPIMDRPMRVTLPNLTHLVLRYDTVQAAELISFIDMPILRVLSLAVDDISVGSLVDTCAPMLCHPKDVVLSLDEHSANDIPRLLQLLTHVERLDLTRCSLEAAKEFLYTIIVHYDAPPRHLKLIIFGIPISSEQATTVSALWARSGHKCRLVGRKSFGDDAPLLETNPPTVVAKPGAADADRMRRLRPRSVAVVHPLRPTRQLVAALGFRTPRDQALTVEDLWQKAGPPHVDVLDDDHKCTICLQLRSHPVL
ncbi:hypothetical protein FB451DRAFT_1405960 [Mycena latifolia]|nr:hypothetical protein FB451DRAFT_1405960 [Mycena latifolia]